VFAGETFVAETREERYIVVIIEPSEAGTTDRPARAFVCDNQHSPVWFAGELVDDQLTLSAEENENQATPPDTRLTATVGAGRVTGEALLEGQTVMFVAAPAADGAGYWEGVRLPGGAVLAMSSTGGRLLGQSPMTATATEEGLRFRIDGIVTLPDGAQRPLTLHAAEPEAANFCTVVLNNARHCLIH
jgi:hypothetical protein